MHRITVPPPRRTVDPPAPEVDPLDALFSPPPATSAPGRYVRRPPRRPPPIVQAIGRHRADRHPGPYDTPQEPIDLGSDCEMPITDLLMQARSTVRPARSSDYLHVSDLIHRCMRALALQEQLGRQPPAQQLRLADRLTYRQGEAIAEVIVAAIQETAPAALWGHWRCRCWRTKTAEPCTRAEATALPACEHCLQPLNEYQEVAMFNEEYKIVGNPDLLLYLEAFNAFHITELKSITPNEFPDLERAKPEHVIQSIFYWWLMRELGYRLTNSVSIVYVNKGHTFKGEQYREFVVDVASQVGRLDMFLEEALAVKAFRAGGNLPPRTRCNTPEDNLAKKCNVCQACFSAANGASRRRVIDVTQFADDTEDAAHESPERQRSRRAPPPAPVPSEPEPTLVLRRSTRVPGPAPAPARDRPVAGQHRLRVPPPRRR